MAAEDIAEAYKVSAPDYTALAAGGDAVTADLPRLEIPDALPVAFAPPGLRTFDGLDAYLRRTSRYQRLKRLQDIVFSSVFILVCGIWLFPVIAILIKLDSPGPVFFRQERVGWKRSRFVCLKFRTMVHNPGACFAQAQKNDPRVTRVGRFLRKTNLDELPQFINVLKGDMAVVGPRPHVQELDMMHCDQVPGYELRNAIRPGVTGLAQVSGCRGETRSIREMQHRVRFDLFYLRNMNFVLDIKIILLTALRVVQGDSKAY